MLGVSGERATIVLLQRECVISLTTPDANCDQNSARTAP